MPQFLSRPLLSAQGDECWGTPGTSSGTWGVGVTSHASSSTTKGTKQELIASTSDHAYWIEIIAGSSGTSGINTGGACFDILIGGSGAEIVLIPDLLIGRCGAYTTTDGPMSWAFPVFIPKGTRIAAQVAATNASHTFNIAVFLYGEAYRLPIVGSYVETIGVTVPNGTSITPGAQTWGTWQQMTSSSSKNYIAMFPSLAFTDSTTAYHRFSLQIGVGASTTESIIGPTYYGNKWNDASFQAQHPHLPAIGRVPSGSRLSMRLWDDSGTPQNMEVALHCVVA